MGNTVSPAELMNDAELLAAYADRLREGKGYQIGVPDNAPSAGAKARGWTVLRHLVTGAHSPGVPVLARDEKGLLWVIDSSIDGMAIGAVVGGAVVDPQVDETAKAALQAAAAPATAASAVTETKPPAPETKPPAAETKTPTGEAKAAANGVKAPPKLKADPAPAEP